MGTVFNAKKWKGACVKGKKVCGLVKNGALFFKSDNYIPPISEIYKRRIMVGDNLGGKNIYNDFKNNNSFFQEWLKTKDYSSFITSDLNTSNYDYFEFYVSSDESTFLSLTVNYPEKSEEVSIYNYANGNVTITPKVTIRDDLDYDAVTSIVESVAYRHLFIEDENIRPLEVGDVITENTKFYFTFPDNFNSSINFEDRKYIVVMDNTYTGFIVNKDYLGSSVVAATISFGFGSTQVEIYEYDNDNDTLLQNDSYRTNIKNGDDNFVGTVTNIDTTDNIYQYILVDTTTLGA